MQRLRYMVDWCTGHVRQLRWVLTRRSARDELAEEFAHHLALETEENIRRGMNPDAARRKALVDFGGVRRFTEDVHSVRWTRWFTDAASDVRYALRSLSRATAYSVATIVTLAVGIGVNIALYSLVNGIAFRMPAGVPESGQLVRVVNNSVPRRFSYADLRDLQRATESTIAIAGYEPIAVNIHGGGGPVQMRAELVTGNYFEVLGMRPARGRWFAADEDAVLGRDAVVIISHRLWHAQFGGVDSIAGASVHINGHPFRVIGVAPPEFRGLRIEEASDLWLPFMTQPWSMPRALDVLQSRSWAKVDAVGALVPGQSLQVAEAQLGIAAQQLPAAKRFGKVNPAVAPLRGWLPPGALGQMRALLAVAGALTMLLLLVCCSNVAGLQLARALKRTRELAVRVALGASGVRVLRMLLTESIVVALVAGGAGTVVAWLFASWFKRSMSVGTTGPIFEAIDITPGPDTVIATVVVSLCAGVFFGLLPSLRVIRPGLTAAMNGVFHAGTTGSRMRTILVGAQVTISLILLALSGLFLSRMQRLAETDIGFDPRRFVAFAVDLDAYDYDVAKRRQFYDELQRRVAAIPGVEAVSTRTYVPLGRGVLGERVSSADANAEVTETLHVVSAGIAVDFFETMGVKALRGRTLRESDMTADTRHVVISDSLARRLWGTRDPIGRVITDGTESRIVHKDTVRVPATAIVVGTVASLPLGALAEPEWMQMFVPVTHQPQVTEPGVVVRTSARATAILPAIRSVVRQLDDRVPLIDARILVQDVDRQLGTQRALTQLISIFGALAVLLALVGLTGMVAANVAARRREIGVRMALGARPGQVSAMFLSRALRIVGTSVVVGAILAVVAGRLVSSAVWGVAPFHAPVLLGAGLLMTSAAAAAAWASARGAAAVDPITILREE